MLPRIQIPFLKLLLTLILTKQSLTGLRKQQMLLLPPLLLLPFLLHQLQLVMALPLQKWKVLLLQKWKLLLLQKWRLHEKNDECQMHSLLYLRNTLLSLTIKNG